MERMSWFERQFQFGISPQMLPFFLERLEGSALRIAEKVKGHTEEVLSKKVDGKWSVKQNIGHLAEVDEVANKRIDEMVNGMATLSPAVFEPKMDYNAQPFHKVLDYFVNARRKNISKYLNLREEDLVKSSLHPRLKQHMTPVDLAWFDAEHDDHHLVTIKELLAKLENQV
jgi:DinB superfamily